MNAPTPGTVPTVRGPIGTEELGTVLTHEHLFIADPEFHRNYPALWDREQSVEQAVALLEEAYELGVRTLVDMTALGQGRDIELIRRVAERTRVNIVVATGLYVLDGLPQILRYRGPGAPLGGPDPIIDFLESDIRQGIAGTDIKAAVLKFVAESDEPDATVRRVAAAVAEVHRRTGVPIVVHTNPHNRSGLAVVEVLGGLGVAPGSITVAHAGDSPDHGYLKELAATGAYLGCDQFGMQALRPDEERIATVLKLVGDGHVEQLLLSHDSSAFMDHVLPEQRAFLYPQWNWTHLHARILPAMREAGLAEADITTMLQDNPRRLLSGVPVAAEAAGEAEGS
ncbi:phosphotriesterase family protein [Allostreptomyces psammosilenae]|uniref:Phosphotriesterase-related protein n=1 Tax=Allostreptomyces psammosilenae TaxID=1892865 RepID=A0A853A2B9_9ACTN|nr:phosphotriesterase-related protein [Allostreptomyces psammosilenae]NYI04911.1 phosphotriesterase-related protein [Allostreptomyces psammosilenae]